MTLADANESHDWRIYADFAQILISMTRPLYATDPIGVDLDETLCALHSTTIDLCLSQFPWAKFRQRKGAIKMPTLLDLDGNIPTFIRVTDGKVADVAILDEVIPEAGDSTWWIEATSISNAYLSSQGLRFDQTVILTAIIPQSATMIH